MLKINFFRRVCGTLKTGFPILLPSIGRYKGTNYTNTPNSFATNFREKGVISRYIAANRSCKKLAYGFSLLFEVGAGLLVKGYLGKGLGRFES